MEIETMCSGCVFFTPEKQMYEMCKLDRLKRFVDNGANIESDINGCPIVKGRYCSAKRPKEWTEGKSKINLPLIVRAELLVNYETIIPIEEIDSSKLKATLYSLKNQIIKPSLVVLNCNTEDIKYPNLIRQMKDSGLPFRIDRILPDKNGNKQEILDALDISLDRVKTDYYLILNNGAIIDEEYVANIDEAINVEMKRFVIVTGKNSIGSFVNFQLHKSLQGNYPVRAKKIDEDCQDENLTLNSLVEKVEYLANKNNHHFLIKSYGDILNG